MCLAPLKIMFYLNSAFFCILKFHQLVLDFGTVLQVLQAGLKMIQAPKEGFSLDVQLRLTSLWVSVFFLYRLRSE